MKDFETFLRREISDLEGELSQDPRWRKLIKLRATLSEYEEGGDAADSPLTRAMAQQAVRSRPVGRQPSEERVRALGFVEDYLRGRSKPTKTKEIFDYLVAEGVELGGKEPASNLSAMLYNSKRFVSHGRAGWTLPNGDDETTSDAASDQSDEEDASPAFPNYPEQAIEEYRDVSAQYEKLRADDFGWDDKQEAEADRLDQRLKQLRDRYAGIELL